MTDDLRARLHAAPTAPHALDALERLVDEVTADLRAENERLKRAEAAQTDLVRAMFDALGGDPVRDTADVLAASVRARAEAAEAEAERLRGDVEHWQQKWKRRGSALGARVETAEGLTEWLWDQSGSLVEMVASGLARAQAAEARVAALETTLANVADEWSAEADRYEQYTVGSSNPHELRSIARTLRQNAAAVREAATPRIHGLGVADAIRSDLQRQIDDELRALDADGADATTGCGHPNHGATDHSCAPFTTDGSGR